MGEAHTASLEEILEDHVLHLMLASDGIGIDEFREFIASERRRLFGQDGLEESGSVVTSYNS